MPRDGAWKNRCRAARDYTADARLAWQPVVKVQLHSAGAASLLHPNAAAALGTRGRAALLLAQILPVFSLVAPCPGRTRHLSAEPSVQRRTFINGPLSATPHRAVSHLTGS